LTPCRRPDTLHYRVLFQLQFLWRRARRILADDPATALTVVRGGRGIHTWAPLVFLIAGASAYGAAMGAWRDPKLAGYVAIKLPMLLVATALVDAVANGLWARRLGSRIGLGESCRAVLMAFALAAVVLGSFAPVLFFLARSLPGPEVAEARTAHDALGLAHVAVIALAGCLAVARQSHWLATLDGRASTATRVVATWLGLNLVVGAQISWNLRPWFGTPGLPVTFLRADPFDGTFYESVFRMLGNT